MAISHWENMALSDCVYPFSLLKLNGHVMCVSTNLSFDSERKLVSVCVKTDDMVLFISPTHTHSHAHTHTHTHTHLQPLHSPIPDKLWRDEWRKAAKKVLALPDAAQVRMKFRVSCRATMFFFHPTYASSSK